MRIAQIAPLTEAVPPTLYGGTERVISWLTEELVALGQDVTLFASGDSVTSAKLEPIWPRALRLDGTVRDGNALHMIALRPQGLVVRKEIAPAVATQGGSTFQTNMFSIWKTAFDVAVMRLVSTPGRRSAK